MNNQKKLIVESYKLSKLQQINKPNYTVPNGCMLIEGVMGRVDSFNRNNRFYRREDYAQRLVEFNQRIEQEGGILGEMEHPKSMNIDLNNVSHKILGVRVDEDGFVRGEVLLLNTSKGRDAQAIVESGTPLPISSRATGRVNEDKSVTLESFATWDLVGTAGFMEASMNKAITESMSNEKGDVIYESFMWDLDERGQVVFEANQNLTETKNLEQMNENEIKNLVERLVSQKLEQGGYIHESKIEKLVNERFESLLVSNQINESKSVDEDDLFESLIEKIDERFAMTYAPMVESWVTGEFAPKLSENFQDWTINEFAPMVEKWTINEFAPMVEKWTINEFAPMVENWTVNEFAPMVEQWTVNEFAPMVEKWTVNEFAPMVEQWTVNEFAPIVEQWVNEESAPSISVNEGIALTNAGAPINTQFSKGNFDKDSEIFRSELLNKVDNLINKSTTHNNDEAVDKKSIGATTTDTLDVNVTEGLVDNSIFENAQPWIKLMPQNKKLVWQSLSESVKESICKRASIRLLNDIDKINEFWDSLDLTNIVSEGVQNQTIRRTFVTENVNEGVANNPRMNLVRIAESMRR